MKNPPSQASLPGLEFKKTLSFGGSLLKKSHAKVSRPLSSKQALHIVLRTDWARGEHSLLKKEREIKNTLLKLGRKHGVRVYRIANAGNHLHLLVRFTKRHGLQNFLRGACGIIARKMLGRERGLALGEKGSERPHGSDGTKSASPRSTAQAQRFWSQRPFTRIVSWGRDFNAVLAYVKLNTLEALGFLDRKFTKALPTQEIRNRVLTKMSLALGTG
jgi:REP element-mobilizing transposase RayT